MLHGSMVPTISVFFVGLLRILRKFLYRPMHTLCLTQRPRNTYLADAPPVSKHNVGVLVGCVIAGVVVAFAALGWCYFSRRRRFPPYDLEGSSISSNSKHGGRGWFPDPKSEFSPDDGTSRKFDRIRKALGHRKKKSSDSILPIYRVSTPESIDSIHRPPPAVPSQVPRYPSELDRSYSKPVRRSPPPPLKGYPQPSNSSSSSYSPTSTEASEPLSWKRVQVPPTAALVIRQSRPLPKIKSAGLRTPKSPSRRKSWLMRNPLNHPFIPSPHLEGYLRYPPNSPLGRYQPSRQQLEARLDSQSPRRAIMSPRLGPRSANQPSRKGKEPVKRQPLPLYEEDQGTTKQVRLVEALHSAVIDGQGTPTGYRTALPPSVHKQPLASGSKFSRDPPPSAFM